MCDGKLYPQNTKNTPGIFPLAVAVSSTYLFVTDTYQPGSSCTTTTPCSGSVGVYPILTAAQAGALTPAQIADTLGTVVANPSNGADYWPLALTGKNSADILLPTGINVSASGAYLYVSKKFVEHLLRLHRAVSEVVDTAVVSQQSAKILRRLACGISANDYVCFG